jgi:hypothetical protein
VSTRHRQGPPSLTTRQTTVAPTSAIPQVNEDVYVSEDKPYTIRLNVAMMNRLAAYCKAHDRGKGPVITEAVIRLLDELEASNE